MRKKILIVSGINLFEGGTLSIIQDCLSFLESNSQFRKYKIIALVHKKALFKAANFNNIEFIEFPKSRKSYFYRIYYEYFYFKKFAKKNKIYFWLSLHDITPSLKNVALVFKTEISLASTAFF